VHDAAPIPARSITTRRVRFGHHDGAVERHFMGGDPAMSHVLAVLSSFFPEGEDFFVRSVRNHRARITDPELKRQVAGFIGQEAIHGREHRQLNRELQALGYPTWVIDRLTKHGLRLLLLLPKAHQLAVTAALEHYTATLAELLMGEERARDRLTDPEIRNLFMWHAMEESEHKSVAFDVFQLVNGKRRIRSGVMHAATIGFLGAIVLGTSASLLVDPHTYRHPRRTARSVVALRRSIFLERRTVARILDYHRRDFHPDDHDSTALLEHWRTELFGEAGTLTDRLKAGAST
jgi:predicted metal-dependent hydrolase